jgi:hypothetical protein
MTGLFASFISVLNYWLPLRYAAGADDLWAIQLLLVHRADSNAGPEAITARRSKRAELLGRSEAAQALRKLALRGSRRLPLRGGSAGRIFRRSIDLLNWT